MQQKEQKDKKQKPFKPQKLDGRTYTMCGKTFQIYSLEGFDFENNIDIGAGCGLYCFSKRIGEIDSVIKNGESWLRLSHALLYLGKSNDFTKRPYEHDKLSELKDAEYLGVYYCNESEDPKEIESTILKKYFFSENKQENKEQEDRKISVVEDPVNL